MNFLQSWDPANEEPQTLGALTDLRIALRHVKYLLADDGYFLLHESFPGTE